jgi:hypothetical protein
MIGAFVLVAIMCSGPIGPIVGDDGIQRRMCGTFDVGPKYQTMQECLADAMTIVTPKGEEHVVTLTCSREQRKP